MGWQHPGSAAKLGLGLRVRRGCPDFGTSRGRCYMQCKALGTGLPRAVKRLLRDSSPARKLMQECGM